MIGPSLVGVVGGVRRQGKIVKINVDENPGTAAKFGYPVDPDTDAVQGWSTHSQKVGGAPKSELSRWIQASA